MISAVGLIGRYVVLGPLAAWPEIPEAKILDVSSTYVGWVLFASLEIDACSTDPTGLGVSSLVYLGVWEDF